MSENVQNLSQELNILLKHGIEVQIPSYITQNLNKDLREYQTTALKHFYLQRKNPQTNHLMFNMATGSGKTLIMAALMLECFKQGYRNFIFFVNSTAILEKTKANFCDSKSEKYLFKDKININTQSVEINAVSNLAECKDGAINVYFSTVQGLYSLFTDEKENAFTLEDLKGRKFVFLADEAHHLNANTKKQSEEDKKSGWEGVINEAFKSCEENLLLEFSATIPNERAVKEKYKDKIIYEYALKEFCQNGYSKRISLAKYENSNLNSRFLGAVLLSLYRQNVAQKNGVDLKPVVLFKSESIKESKENELKFKEFLQNLQARDIREFFNGLQEEKNKENHFLNSREFFKNEFKDSFESVLENLIKANFISHFILNVNDENEAIQKQLLLNSLESKHNEIRVIFAVNKLNEGWDVLNLFDIVRLSGKKANSNTTTQEVQLIGRGARYCPFELKRESAQMEVIGEKFKRKFDNDSNNEMGILERLTYHTLNDVEFIEKLNAKMKEVGLFDEFEEERVVLKPTKRASEVTNGEFKLYFVGNSRYKFNTNLFKPQDKSVLTHQVQSLDIPPFSNSINESEIFNDTKLENTPFQERLKKFEKGKIAYNVFLKALNVVGLKFEELKRSFDIKSKLEFFELVSNLNLEFDKKQEFTRRNQLSIAKFIISKLKENLQDKGEFEVSEFKKKEIKMQERVILRQRNEVQSEVPQWLYYDKYTLDSELEKEFVKFIEAHKDELDKAFAKWIVFRNEGFNEFKIYDNRKGEASYASGFEPDFIFFGARSENDKALKVQGIFEVKGDVFTPKDKWKENLLKIISGTYNEGEGKGIEMQVKGFPFFTRQNGVLGREFLNEFELFIKVE